MTLGTPMKFLLVYSSQTGQAQAIAEEVAERAPNHGLQAEIRCVSTTEKKFWLERERCLVFITSTTGDGEPPDTAGKLWRRIRKKTLPSDHLSQLHYALLGLGDSNYTNFCRCGKLFDKRFEELGAQKFLPSAFADDATGLEVVVEPWMESLFPALKEHLSSHGNSADIDDSNAANNVLAERANENGSDFQDSPNQNGFDSHLDTTTHRMNQNKTGQGLEVSNEKLTNNALNGLTSEKLTKDSESASLKQKDTQNANLKSSTNENGIVNAQNAKDLLTDSSCARDDADKLEENVVESLTRSVPPISQSALNLPALPPRYLEISKSSSRASLAVDDNLIQNGYPFPSAHSDIHKVPVVAAQVLTSDDAIKKAIKISLDTSGTDFKYEPGDAFGVVCQNDPEEVQELLDRLGVSDSADVPCTLSILPDNKKRSASLPAHLPPEGTTRRWLTDCDLRGPLKKTLVRSLIPHTTDPKQQRRLQELVSRQGAEIYNKYIRGPALGLIDLLQAFPSCAPPLSLLIEHLPRLAARTYSAASCQLVSPNTVDFVFNVVEIPSGEGRSSPRKGICTGWLDKLTSCLQTNNTSERDTNINEQMETLKLESAPPKIPVFLRSNQHFRHPDDITKPLILIGPGTGVAPFIGFLHHREAQISQLSDKTTMGQTWLFFGCRHKERDYLFRDELGGVHSRGVITELCVCFSRDNDHHDDGSPSPKYVQDAIRLHGNQVISLVMDDNAEVYVCGDAKNMAKDVRSAFVELLVKHRDIEPKEAELIIMDLVIKKRYHEDVWA